MSSTYQKPVRFKQQRANADRFQGRPRQQASDGKPSRNLWQRRHAEFTALARTAAANGDDVDAENYYQHAEHYLRMMQGTAA